MKAVFLSTAIKNAGDYLINERSQKLFRNIFKDCKIKEYSILESLQDVLEEINSVDLIVIPGGPITKNDYPVSVPLVRDLTEIKTPMVEIGVGWYGRTGDLFSVNNYFFSEENLKYLNKIKNGKMFACRDWETVRVMNNNGIKGAIMTGCPAWYDLEYIDLKEINKEVNIPFQKIGISNPAYAENHQLVLPIVEYLQKKYINCEISYLAHRGFTNNKLIEKLENRGVEVRDIAYSSQGLEFYDECDLHIGFRVHGHIYCMSHRIPTVLIEEDGRGAGANHALGTRGIRSYHVVKYNPDIQLETNHNLICELDDYLNDLEKANYKVFEMAYDKMEFFYHVMNNYLYRINDIL